MNHTGEAHLRPVDCFVYDTIYGVNTQERREATYADLVGSPKCRWRRGTLQNSVSRLSKQHFIGQWFSGCAFLTVKDVDGVSIKKVKPTHMEVPLLLSLLPEGQEQIHNVRLRVSAHGLYERLVRGGWSKGKGNGDLALTPLTIGKERTVSMRVHGTDTVTVRVACSGNPFRVNALSELVLLLDQVKDALEHEYLARPLRLPPIAAWTVIAWEHGLDGRHAFEGESFSMTFQTWSGFLARFYAKDVGAGHKRLRLEVIEAPSRPLDEALHQLLARDPLHS